MHAFGKDSRILLHDFDHSTYLKNYDVGDDFDVLDTTAFLDSAQKVEAGLEKGKIALGGMFDVTNEAEFASRLAETTGRVATVAPVGTAIGKRLYAASVKELAFKVGSQIGQLHVVTIDLTADEDGIDIGWSLHDVATAESASTNSASHDNAAASTNGGVGFLHVVQNSRSTSTTIKIQSSSDNGGADPWADIITFTAVGTTVKTSERVEVTGNVERYLRCISTLTAGTGTITYAVGFARR